MYKVFFLFLASLMILPSLVIAAGTSTVASPTCISLTRNVQYGSRDTKSNYEVIIIQSFLMVKGYFTGKINGVFGTDSVIALKKFQKANKISGTGVVGPLTRAKIKALLCVSTTTATAKTNSVAINNISPNKTPVSNISSVNNSVQTNSSSSGIIPTANTRTNYTTYPSQSQTTNSTNNNNQTSGQTTNNSANTTSSSNSISNSSSNTSNTTSSSQSSNNTASLGISVGGGSAASNSNNTSSGSNTSTNSTSNSGTTASAGVSIGMGSGVTSSTNTNSSFSQETLNAYSYINNSNTFSAGSSATNQTNNSLNTTQNVLNFGTLPIRVIVANVDELGSKYGSYGIKFTASKLAEVDQSLNTLNNIIKQSSYGQLQLQWEKTGVFELGKGVCDHTSYGEKTKDLLLRALSASDAQTPLNDYSYFMVVHPQPDCSDNLQWSIEGGVFTTYTINGRTLHLRGIRTTALESRYVMHEFGHSLGYSPNTYLGHPSYIICPIITNGDSVKVDLSGSCQQKYDFYNNIIPSFTIMTGRRNYLSDYSSLEKEKIGWLSNPNIIVAGNGEYVLSPLEQTGPAPRALKIPVTGSGYTVYVSFRQPVGYTYPSAPSDKPNGVVIDFIKDGITGFLVTNSTNLDAPLKVGSTYSLGPNGTSITLKSISNNQAVVVVSGQ